MWNADAPALASPAQPFTRPRGCDIEDGAQPDDHDRDAPARASFSQRIGEELGHLRVMALAQTARRKRNQAPVASAQLVSPARFNRARASLTTAASRSVSAASA